MKARFSREPERRGGELKNGSLQRPRLLDGGGAEKGERGQPARHRGDHQFHQRERGSHRPPQGNL